MSLLRHFLHLASVWALMRVLMNYDRRANRVARATVSSRTVTRTTRLMLASWLSATLCAVPSVVDATEAVLIPAEAPGALSEALDAVRQAPLDARRRADNAAARLARQFAIEPWLDRYAALYDRVAKHH